MRVFPKAILAKALTTSGRPAIMAGMKSKAKPVKKIAVNTDEFRDLSDTLEIGTDPFDAGVINPDPLACPNCGGDLEDGDHLFCSKF
jgi:hypothetical protein